MREVRIGENIRALREYKEIPRYKLCEAIGISKQALDKMEYFHGGTRLTTAIAIAEYFNISLDELVFGKAEDLFR